MKLAFLYLGLLSFVGISGGAMYHAFNIEQTKSAIDGSSSPIIIDRMVGHSMEPALTDDALISYDTSKTIPMIGDVVVFDCFTEKCTSGSKYGKLSRLRNIDANGCYWFLGDNQDNSLDSRTYSWLCPPNDIKIIGILTGLDNSAFTVKNEPIKPVTQKPIIKSTPKPQEKTEPATKSKKKTKSSSYTSHDYELDNLMDDIRRDNEKQEKAMEKEAAWRSSHPGMICLYDSYGNAIKSSCFQN